MRTLKLAASHEQTVRKSRFMALCAPVSSEEAARAFLATHSVATATHNCWAFRIGQIYRFQDDGEPSGTAGRPILQAIDGQGLDHVVVLVIRWFGGILLGAGGLMRAYGGTAAMALRAGETTEIIETLPAVIDCGFGDLAILKARLAGADVVVSREDFTTDGARLAVEMPKDRLEPIKAMVRDLSAGRVRISFDD